MTNEDLREFSNEAGREREFILWKERFQLSAKDAGIPAGLLEAVLPQIRLEPKVLKLQSNQSEFISPIWEYVDAAMPPERIAAGKDAMAAHRNDLEKIEIQFGVEGSFLVAIWGIETNYGTKMGEMPVLNSLATLAFGSNRKPFFENELTDAFRILATTSVYDAKLCGSWAGAFGHTQFMPSSFIRFATSLDYGEANICKRSPVDALASAANYLRSFGWISGQPWGMEVKLPLGFDYLLADGSTEKSPGTWNRLGVRLPDNSRLPDCGNAAILLPAGCQGPALAVFSNFRVIGFYNRSLAYMIAVGHLSDRLKGGPSFEQAWPRYEQPLSPSLIQEIQLLLTSLGFDTKGADGIAGPDTMAGIRMFQARENLIPDGFATACLLERLRSASTSL
ncbi:MAG: lytic murein transglycosylase [Albidovulum sp.]|nr:lytic murein transglycosylase [Albidovulum sp.]MDE0532273.1 lytic murein transglycosylase [Albidovulum sp.]